MTAPVPLRIGDADRDRAVAALGDHFAAGRLTADEFDDRSSRAWQARTGRHWCSCRSWSWRSRSS
jgi:hypothetical protein